MQILFFIELEDDYKDEVFTFIDTAVSRYGLKNVQKMLDEYARNRIFSIIYNIEKQRIEVF
jgi:hypothetical protein